MQNLQFLNVSFGKCETKSNTDLVVFFIAQNNLFSNCSLCYININNNNICSIMFTLSLCMSSKLLCFMKKKRQSKKNNYSFIFINKKGKNLYNYSFKILMYNVYKKHLKKTF